MSTIAIKGKTIAADTLVSADTAIYGYARKIACSRDCWWVGAAGATADTMPLLEAVRTSRMEKWAPPDLKWKTLSVAGITPDGRKFYMERGIICFLDTPYMAEGSGRAYAMGAMEFGADAINAVETAKKIDHQTGGRIEWAFAGDPVLRTDDKAR